MNCPHCGIEVDEHPASRCLDLWVEQTVHPAEGLASIAIPLYSTEIAAAWMAVEKVGMWVGPWGLLDAGWVMVPQWRAVTKTGYENSVSGFRDEGADALTAPLAICRAALKAVDNQPKAE